jgi:hypothetical protein
MLHFAGRGNRASSPRHGCGTTTAARKIPAKKIDFLNKNHYRKILIKSTSLTCRRKLSSTIFIITRAGYLIAAIKKPPAAHPS